MLFDLQGKRRRVVQATYLILAVLMGGGLIFFGVGSGDISGGLFDAITGKDSNSNSAANDAVHKRIKADLVKLKVNAKNQQALADLVRSHYQLATDDADATTGQFGDTGKAELAKADGFWKRYVAAADKPSDSLASLMLQAYAKTGLDKPADAVGAATIIAAARPSPQAYLALTQYAAAAGQTREAKLAAQKAIDLATPSQKKQVTQQAAIAQAQGSIDPSQVTPNTGTSGG